MMNRREFNKTLIAVSGLGAGLSLGIFSGSAMATAWPTSAFEAETVEDAVKGLYGTAEAEVSEAITFKAPDIAENGAVVPVSVSADIANADSVALLVPENPAPLAATFELVQPGKPSVSTRIKMGKTSPLIAMVRADGKLYTATSKEIKVTIGGCGG